MTAEVSESAVLGSWDIDLRSALGAQRFTIEIEDRPELAGRVYGAEGEQPLEALHITGDSATFVIAVDKPMKLRTTWAVTATGDQIAGTVRAGILPAMKVAGARSGTGVMEPPAAEEPARLESVGEGTTTRAAVLRSADGPFVIEEIRLPGLAAGEVLVRVAATGICHTDSVARDVWSGPIILGHEASGVVVAVGVGVRRIAVGDHVVVSFDSCGVCVGCIAGRPYDCDAFDTMNFNGRGERTVPARDASGSEVAHRWFGQSSFAEHCIATERNVVVVPRDIPLDILAPLGCGVMTGAGSVLNVMGMRPGQRLAVFGAGAVGLSAILAAAAIGAAEIVAVDTSERRRELARELGAHRAIDPAAVLDLSAAVLGDGEGFDFSFDTTARSDVMSAAVEVLRRPGLCVLVGAGLEPLTFVPPVNAGRTITYAYMGKSEPRIFIGQLIDLWRQGRFPFDRLIEKFPLDRIDEAERAAAIGAVVKPVITMTSA